MIKKITLSWMLAGFVTLAGLSQQVSVYDLLRQIPGAEVREIAADTMFKAAWEVMIPQPLDHKHKWKGTFKQRVWVSYRDSLSPVVMITEGYSAGRNYVSELARLTGANQIIVEHRYFGRSVPDTLEWQYLTIEQAAADHHHIFELFKKAWPGKWISTGISKGGQTTMYFKYFYPEDADVCVPYVGPLNFSLVDTRIFSFLDSVGSDDCRRRIRAFQMRVLKERKEVFPLFEEYSKKKGYSYIKAGGDSAAYEYAVMEFPFSFWQWGMKCEEIPGPEASAEELFRYFKKANVLDYFSDRGIAWFEAFYYQAMTQLGYYGYRPSLYKGEIRNVRDTTFLFTVPEGSQPVYDPGIMRKVNAFLQDEGDHFIYIYGGTDTWSATAVRLHGKVDALTIFKKDGCHTTCIRNLSPAQRDRVIRILGRWLDTRLYPERL